MEPLDEEEKANAHLISACPEMFDALKDAIRTMKVYGTNNMGFCIERCEKVLSKAEGKE